MRDSDRIGSLDVSLSERLREEAPDVTCEYGGIMTNDGKVLWSRNADATTTMASTTKIMTAVTVLECGDVTDSITVSENAASVDGSSAELTAGDVLTTEQLLYCMMLPSGNDAAMALAEYYGGGDASSFVDMMNEKAEQLGMVSTHFVDSIGLADSYDGHYTTVNDYLELIRYAMGNDLFRTICSTLSYEYTSTATGQTVSISSTDELLGDYDGMLGGKTGFTDAAGYCLVSTAERDGVEIYSVVFGADSASSRFSDCAALYDWGFAHYHDVELLAADTVVAQAVAASWFDRTFPVVVEQAVSAKLFDYDADLSVKVEAVALGGAVSIGDVVGSVSWETQSGDVVATAELVAAEDVPAPGFLDTLQILWARFCSLFTGDPGAVQTVEIGETYELVSAHV